MVAMPLDMQEASTLADNLIGADLCITAREFDDER
jgi:hypothetical protein